jgi:hypothetical protein
MVYKPEYTPRGQTLYVGSSYSFDLNEVMVEILRKEFGAQKVAEDFAKAVAGKKGPELEKAGAKFFEKYGKDWMKRAIQLGDEYPDRTYEVVKQSVDGKGNVFMFWPLLPQRCLEIAYLGTQDFLTLPMVESHYQRLIYKVVDCATFKNIKAKSGDAAANLMTCKNGCLTACQTMLQGLKLSATLNMDAAMVKDGYCQFRLTRG